MRFKDFHKNIKIRIIETFMSRFIGSMIFPFILKQNHEAVKAG
jgi:MFS transporter, DHA1 family, multidrug resistance protein B